MDGGKRRVESTCVGGDMKNKMRMNEIMLRYRPIAPKPVTVERSTVPVKVKRAKRKYVRVKEKVAIKDNRKLISFDMVNDSNGSSEIDVVDRVQKVPDLISFDVYRSTMNGINMESDLSLRPAKSLVDLHETDLLKTMNSRQVVESWIMVESVTGTCEDVKRLCYEEVVKELEVDSCPGFISNGHDEIEWVNLAYRRMVDPDRESGANPPEVVVWLKAKVEKDIGGYWQAFSCRVRVVYELLEKKNRVTITVPCDVWKMDSGGYAWRFDVKAALSLGRLNT